MIELSGPQIASRVFMRGKTVLNQREDGQQRTEIRDCKPRNAGGSGSWRSQEQILLGSFQKEPALLVPWSQPLTAKPDVWAELRMGNMYAVQNLTMGSHWKALRRIMLWLKSHLFKSPWLTLERSEWGRLNKRLSREESVVLGLCGWWKRVDGACLRCSLPQTQCVGGWLWCWGKERDTDNPQIPNSWS